MRLRTLIGLLPLGFALVAPGAATADTSPPTFPILPNQWFAGVVNGQTANATIRMVCPGPAGGTGHPASGQTLSVNRVSPPTDTTNFGFTGSEGTSIAAAPAISSTTTVPVIFTEYFRPSALPTTWTLPCEGDGRIDFTPRPTSSTARTAHVPVHFVNIATTPA